MAQVISGVRAIFSNPTIYSAFQAIMGAHQARTRFVAEFVRPYAAMKVLDLGCGPADILSYLPDVDYWGFDICEAYIERANVRFGGRGKFYCQELTSSEVEKMPLFDTVLAVGLLHHLDDEVAKGLIQLASKALKPAGRLLTVDPCIDPDQNPIARLLVMHDRGQNVRNKSGYASLASASFASCHVEVRHQTWIPYTHCYMECSGA